MFKQLEEAKDKVSEHQKMYEEALRFVYRIRQTRMVNGRWLFYEKPHQDIKLKKEKIPAAWKSDKPYTDAQTAVILDEILKSFEPAAK